MVGGDHGATRDLLRRVTATLEALSSYGSLPNALSAGRLTDDVEPPGFEALAGLPSGGKKRPAHEPVARVRSQPAPHATKSARAEQRAAERAARRVEQQRNKALVAAEAAVRDAERALKVARKQADRAAARLEAATAESNDATAAVASAERALATARRQLQHSVA